MDAVLIGEIKEQGCRKVEGTENDHQAGGLGKDTDRANLNQGSAGTLACARVKRRGRHSQKRRDKTKRGLVSADEKQFVRGGMGRDVPRPIKQKGDRRAVSLGKMCERARNNQ